MKKFLAALSIVAVSIVISSSAWAIPTATTPEPSTFVLFGLGIAGLCGIAYRRKK